jgi:hypothetical protein
MTPTHGKRARPAGADDGVRLGGASILSVYARDTREPSRPRPTASVRNWSRVELPCRLPRQVESRLHCEAWNRHRGSRRVRLLAGSDSASVDTECGCGKTATSRCLRTDRHFHSVTEDRPSPFVSPCLRATSILAACVLVLVFVFRQFQFTSAFRIQNSKLRAPPWRHSAPLLSCSCLRPAPPARL